MIKIHHLVMLNTQSKVVTKVFSYQLRSVDTQCQI